MFEALKGSHIPGSGSVSGFRDDRSGRQEMRWGHIMKCIPGHDNISGFNCDEKQLGTFEQGSDIIWFVFLKVTLFATVFRIDYRQGKTGSKEAS